MFNPRWRPAQFAALAHTVLDIFGPSRVMFGSNFPVDGLHRSYAEIVETTHAAVAAYGAAALASVFEDTALCVFSLQTMKSFTLL